MKNKLQIVLYSLLSFTAISLVGCSDKVENNTSIINISSGIIGGDLRLDGNIEEVNIGDDVTVRILTDTGYTLDNLVVNGEVIENITDTYTFEATLPEYYLDAHFSLIENASSLTLSGTSMIGLDETSTLSYELYGAGNVLSWSSSDENILTVDQNGTVKGINPGIATVTATSLYNEDLSASKTIFVMPSYFENMVNTFTNVDLNQGIQVNANLSLNVGLPLPVPIQVSIKNDASTLIPDIYLNIDTSDMMTSMMISVIAQVTDIFSSFGEINYSNQFTGIEIYLLDGNNIEFVLNQLVNNTPTATAYTSTTVGSAIGNVIFDLLPLITQLGTSEGNLSLNLDALIQMLSSFITISSDAKKGIYLNDSAINAINEQGIWTMLIDLISEALGSDLAPMISQALPSQIGELSLTFVEENNVFQSTTLSLKGLDESTSEKTNFLDVTLNAPLALEENYFTTLEEKLASIKESFLQ